MAEGEVSVRVRGDCGHEFQVSLVGHDPHTMEFTCPDCGAVDRFDADTATSIMEQYEAAKVAAVGRFQDDVGKMLRDATRGSKHIKYTTGRHDR